MLNKKQDHVLIATLSSLLLMAIFVLLLQLIFISQEDTFLLVSTDVLEFREEDEMTSVENSSVASNVLSEKKSEEKSNADKKTTKKINATKKKQAQKESIEKSEKKMKSEDDFEQIQTETHQKQIIESEQLLQKKNQYTGLSSYLIFLQGRKIIKESPPIYKCQKAGKVIILIQVNRFGDVAQAQISKENKLENSEKIDNCLKESAIESAYKTKFNADSTAGRLQNGKIIFIFTAQK